MRRIIAILISVVVLVAFSSCANEPDGEVWVSSKTYTSVSSSIGESYNNIEKWTLTLRESGTAKLTIEITVTSNNVVKTTKHNHTLVGQCSKESDSTGTITFSSITAKTDGYTYSSDVWEPQTVDYTISDDKLTMTTYDLYILSRKYIGSRTYEFSKE